MEAKGVNQRIVDVFSNELEAKLSYSKKFTVVTRQKIEQVIQEQKFQVTCSAEKCAIELGKFLGADIIVGEITYLGADDYNVTVRLIKTADAQIITSISEFPTGKIGEIIKTLPGSIASELIKRMRLPASIELFMNPSNALIYVDGEIIGTTPMIYDQITPGNHIIEVIHPGYEKWSEQHTFVENEIYVPYLIDLQKKTKFKAFKKSMLFPGLGQIYSADENNKGRIKLGYMFSGVSIVNILLITDSWVNYTQANSSYNDAYEEYKRQKLIDDVVQYRTIVENKHGQLIDAEKALYVYAGLLGLIWFGNAIEASINFPENRFFSSSTNFNLALNSNMNVFSPKLEFQIVF